MNQSFEFTALVDFRNLRTVRQIAAECEALTVATLQRWMFHRLTNGLVQAVVEIDANTYVDVLAFNAWLYDGKPYIGDFRNLMRVQQILSCCRIKESKLRHWLKYREANGLNEAVIVKKHREKGMLFIDYRKFNAWLSRMNTNNHFSEERAFAG